MQVVPLHAVEPAQFAGHPVHHLHRLGESKPVSGSINDGLICSMNIVALML